MPLLAERMRDQQPLPARQAAWSSKTEPTFFAALALVLQQLWPATAFCISAAEPDLIEIPRDLFERLTEMLTFAAQLWKKSR